MLGDNVIYEIGAIAAISNLFFKSLYEGGGDPGDSGLINDAANSLLNKFSIV